MGFLHSSEDRIVSRMKCTKLAPHTLVKQVKQLDNEKIQ